MSSSALVSNPSTSLQSLSFHPHGHRKGARPDAASGTSASSSSSSTSSTSGSTGNTSGITIGQLPVGAATPLFNQILQSLQQTVGAATAVSRAAPAVSRGVPAVSGKTPAAVTTAGAIGSTTAGLPSLGGIGRNVNTSV